MNVEIVTAYDRIDDIKVLFQEYIEWIGLPLDFQDIDEEMDTLPGHYAEPEGRLFLLLAEDEAAGCIGLRSFDAAEDGARRCEMKRLFVRDRFKGNGFGSLLADRIIEEAKKSGYSEMLLDTFPFMERAVAMYRRLGFEEIEPYRFNPYAEAKYMRLYLR